MSLCAGRLRSVLVVVKQTPYESSLQLKAQGLAPAALRWDILKNRYEEHKACVANVDQILNKSGIQYSIIGRDELHRGMLIDRDLLIGLGGDGTVLNCASFLDDSIPLLGINSDPNRIKPQKQKPKLNSKKKGKNHRHSTGKLCALSAVNVDSMLPKLLHGDYPEPVERTRIQCLVRSTYKETRLPPALNDILLAHPSPAAVSRMRVSLCKGNVEPSFRLATPDEESQVFSLNAWSSGMWVSTASGSTAAMKAAGGEERDFTRPELQYKIREHLVEREEDCTSLGHGFVNTDERIVIQWNSQRGSAFVDGAHMEHELILGDIIELDGHAASLHLYSEPP